MNKETVEEAAEQYTQGNSLEFAYLQEIPAFKAGAEWQKKQLSAPTDEEIEEKAATYAKTQHKIPAEMLNSIDQYDREHVTMIEQSIEDSKKDYLFGYKQALKDLGHE
jgi:hypothetical protein